jgi:Protein of unknown function (DUF1353)
MPFMKLAGEGPGDPDVLLKQVGPNRFQLLHGFRYQVPPNGAIHLVPAHDVNRPPSDPNNSTDLASVPFWLWWFVASYGLHTRAALLHDHLVDVKQIDRVEADRVFRLALEESKVRWMRRWLMWTAVSLATMALKARARFAAFVGMLVLFVGVLAEWPLGWLSELPGDLPAWVPALVVFVLGFAFGLLWPLAVLGLLLIAGPTLVVWAVLAIVWLLDLAKAVGNKVRGRPFERPPLLPPREPRPRF